ncbi:MAG TPA: DUF885 family protein [Mycobacteriales bacterium]|nr:DUF885 family protein [Mycobacteriales bacterium]
MDQRMRALCDTAIPLIRDGGGRHEYDGMIQDLSPGGVTSALAALGGPAYDDPYDDALVAAKEAEARVVYGELQMHRWNPYLHVQNLDLAGYDREYAPAAERAAAKARHLARWPDAVAAALAALDQVSAPVAAATVDAARGLAAGLVRGRDAAQDAALDAQARLVAHLEAAAADGSPDAALGGAALTRLLSAAEAIPVDLAELAAQADSERDRLWALAEEACGRIEPGRAPADLLPELLRDHPDPDGVLTESRALTEEVIAWTKEHELVPYHDGECRVGITPESRQWAVAMMSWAAPGEPPGPSWYHVTPPKPDWPAAAQSEWLQLFSRTTLPAITVHEVAPGHFSHGVALRHASSLPRQLALSEAFIEGWAHYVEEVAVEEGFHADDPRFALGVAVEALVRVTRLACAIGLHTGTMTVDDATRRFEQDAFLAGPAARAEARRGTFDPSYGRYTWGKLAIQALREQARSQWDTGFSLPRFHKALLDLGAPPLGLLGHALGAG